MILMTRTQSQPKKHIRNSAYANKPSISNFKRSSKNSSSGKSLRAFIFSFVLQDKLGQAKDALKVNYKRNITTSEILQ